MDSISTGHGAPLFLRDKTQNTSSNEPNCSLERG